MKPRHTLTDADLANPDLRIALTPLGRLVCERAEALCDELGLRRTDLSACSPVWDRALAECRGPLPEPPAHLPWCPCADCASVQPAG